MELSPETEHKPKWNWCWREWIEHTIACLTRADTDGKRTALKRQY
jgi:hypothetical protein